jgi:hypothetical protein
LRRGGRCNQEQGAENHSKNSSFDHGGHCTLRPEVPATRHITPQVIPQSRGQQPVHPGGIGFQPVRNPFGYCPRQAEACPTAPETEGSPPGSNFPPAALLWRDPQMPTGDQLSPRLSFWTLRGWRRKYALPFPPRRSYLGMGRSWSSS